MYQSFSILPIFYLLWLSLIDFGDRFYAPPIEVNLPKCYRICIVRIEVRKILFNTQEL